MKRPLAIAAVALIASLALVACGGDDDEDTTAPAADTAAEEAGGSADTGNDEGAGGKKKGGGDKGGGITIATADSQFGEALFDGDDRAIYYFDKEKSDTSECYGECAAAWPPVLTDGDPKASGGAQANLLGTTERDDGKTQVTYDGHPLYYYVDDPKGQILCHNVNEFGGLWLAVQPNGQAFG
jgi:predicted lipoprotein with Yx(FWY)xxD motif